MKTLDEKGIAQSIIFIFAHRIVKLMRKREETHCFFHLNVIHTTEILTPRELFSTHSFIIIIIIINIIIIIGVFFSRLSVGQLQERATEFLTFAFFNLAQKKKKTFTA